MADLLVKQTGLATNTVFRNRVRLAMVTIAKTIQGEVQGAQSSNVWQKRQQLSYDVLVKSDSLLDRFAWAVAANTAITTVTPVAISSSTVGPPTVVTTAASHNLVAGDTVEIANHVGNTNANGGWIVFSAPTGTTFTIPTAGNAVGTATGFVFKHPTDQSILDEITAIWNRMAGVTLSDG
jgi:hypothetical protein